MVKPAPVPRPGIAGGPKVTIAASGICWANALLRAATMPFACASGVVRWAHSLSWMKKKPWFEE